MSILDFEAYFAMKSDPLDISMSGFAAPPDPASLKHWLAAELEKPTAALFVVVWKEARHHAIGYLFLRRSGKANYEAEISYGIAPEARGHKLGRRILKLAGQVAVSWNPHITRIVCWVAVDNVASLASVANAGFVESCDRREAPYLLPKPHRKTMRKFVLEVP